MVKQGGKGRTVSAWMFIGIGAVLIALGTISVGYGWHKLAKKPVPELPAVELATQAYDISQQVLNFLTDRERNEPQVDFENWDESTRSMLEYSTETRNLYSARFGAKVVFYRDELKKYGLSDELLNMLCTHATNSIVIRDGAIALGNLALKLSSMHE